MTPTKDDAYFDIAQTHLAELIRYLERPELDTAWLLYREEVVKLRREHQILRSELLAMWRKLDEGTLHSVHCAGDLTARVGTPGKVCTCPLGKELKQLRQQIQDLTVTSETGRRDTARLNVLETLASYSGTQHMLLDFAWPATHSLREVLDNRLAQEDLDG